MILGRNERAFALESLMQGGLDLERLRALAAGGLSWRRLIATCSRVGLAPAVASAAMVSGSLGSIPPDCRQILECALAHNAAQNAALLSLTAKVQALLRGAGVASLPIKGTAILLRQPQLSAVRVVSDLDLLVRPADILEASRLLKRSGWRRVTRTTEIDVRGRERPSGAELLDSPHGVTLVGPTELILELHHALPAADGAPLKAGEAFFARGSPVSWLGSSVDCPSLDDLLAVACEHVLVHHRDHLVHIPRLVLDLSALMAAGADPKRAKALWPPEVAAAIDDGLLLLEEARLGARHPSLLGRGRPERAISLAWRVTHGLKLRWRTYVDFPGWLRQGWRNHRWRLVFPVRAFMVARYRVKPRSPIVPLLYLWRPLRKLYGLLFRR